jgi:phenylpyruvate tautomerase PptA (4-oxalocrotonate tautomerase family)
VYVTGLDRYLKVLGPNNTVVYAEGGTTGGHGNRSSAAHFDLKSERFQETFMPFARIDLVQGKTSAYRAAVADVVYRGIVDVLKAPDGDRFIVIGEHSSDNLIYDPHFLGWDRSPDFILIQVTSTVGNNKESKLAFFRYIADELKSKLSVRPDDIMINLVFVDRSDWSFGNGEPW